MQLFNAKQPACNNEDKVSKPSKKTKQPFTIEYVS